jgi:hypothetical protein
MLHNYLFLHNTYPYCTTIEKEKEIVNKKSAEGFKALSAFTQKKVL